MYNIFIKNFYREGKLVREETLLYTVPIRPEHYDNVLTDPAVSIEIGKTGTFEFQMHPNHPYYHAIAQMRTIMRVEYDGDTIFRGRILTVDNTLAGAKKVHCEGDMAFLLDSFQMSSNKESRKKIKLSEYLSKILEEHNRQMSEELAMEAAEASSSLTPGGGYTQPGYTIDDGKNTGNPLIIGGGGRTDGQFNPDELDISDLINGNEAAEVVYESDKNIYPGYLPGSYPEDFPEIQKIEDKEEKFGSDSHEQTMSALEDLTRECGGFFRTRYSAEDGKTYLDWCRNWFRKDEENSQPIAITKNIIDAQSNSEVDNIFTAVIPVGSKKGKDIFIKGYKESIHGKDNNRILVPQLTKVYTADELNTGYVTRELYANAVKRYGIIYKVQSFPNADTQEKLWKYACDWIKNNYVGGITDYDLSAVDMHHVNGQIVKYLAGDCIPLVLPSDMTEHDGYIPDKRNSTILRTLLSVKYNLHNPDKNSYTAGVPSDILNVEYGTKSTSKSKSGSSSKGAGKKAGSQPPKDDSNDKKEQARQKALDQLAYELTISASYNSEEFAAIESKNEKAATAALQTTKMVVKKILDDDPENPKFDEQKITTMVMDGEKGKLSMIPPSDAQEIFYRMYGDGWQNNPEYLAMISTNEAFVNATNGMLMDAGKKALELRGSSTMTKDQIEDAINAAKESGEITGDETPEELVAKIENITGDVVDPNVVAAIRTTIDEQGNESGKIELSDEDNPTVDVDGGGNDGTGTIHVGHEGGGGEWLINMNEPLKYKDPKTGNTVTLPNGVIDAADYAVIKAGLEPIPSFTTQIAVIKTIIADVVHANELDAVKATIKDLDAEVAKIDRLTSSVIASNGVISATTIGGTSGYFGSLYIGDDRVKMGTTYNVRLADGGTAYISYLTLGS